MAIHLGFSLAAAAAVAAVGLSQPAAAQEFKANLTVGSELRFFVEKAEWPGQDTRRVYPSIYGEADLSYGWDGNSHSFNLVPFGRYDAYDDRRSHVDLREANYRFRGGEWEVLVGAHRVFWGVTESRHLVNVINQVDAVEDVDGDDYLGQPMIDVTLQGDWGRLDLFAMTFFRERTFNANDSRLRGPLPIETNDPEFESGDKKWNVDLAARYQNSFGPVDLGLSVFHGTNREPWLRSSSGANGPVLRPYYQTMTQTGIDVAWAVGDLVLKAEALYRFGQGSPFFATVFGGEYTVKNALGLDIDMGLLAEFNFDDRDVALNPATIYDKDAFTGVRFTFNDQSDANVLIGALIDVEDASTYLYFEASRRLFVNWRVEFELRYFAADGNPGALRALDSDSFVQLRLLRFF